MRIPFTIDSIFEGISAGTDGNDGTTGVYYEIPIANLI